MYTALKFTFLFVLTLSLLFNAPTASAQTAFGAGDFKAPEAQQYAILNLFDHTGPCFGIDHSNVGGNHRCGDYDPQGHFIGYAHLPNGGAIGALSSTMVAMYNSPPTSTTQYLANVGSELGLVPTAHAQVVGSGNSVILPIITLWEVVRNLSYVGFILVIMVIGFMIMFRQRFNPQTVVTVQLALPRIAIGLALVTFSYLIAAVLLDVSFVVFQLAALLFGQVGNGVGGSNGLGNATELGTLARNVNLFTLFTGFVLNGNTLDTVRAPITSALHGVNGGIQPSGNFIFDLVLNPFNTISGGVVGSLVYFVLIVAVVFQMVRLVWAMLQAYISIFINTILGPIFILYGTIPGRQGAITFWWKNILGNALIFPAVFIAFLFAGLIVATPPGQFGSSMPLLSFPQGFIRAILAFGIILSTPAIPKAVKGALGVKELGDFASVALAGAATGAAAVGAFNRGGSREFSNYLGLPARKRYLEGQATTGAASGRATRLPDWVSRRLG